MTTLSLRTPALLLALCFATAGVTATASSAASFTVSPVVVTQVTAPITTTDPFQSHSYVDPFQSHSLTDPFQSH
jgi:hypothetical protein